ncbi:hypothetical protein LTR17_012417 [Elasticomyces elasticus]|nr:hypothetical protein LTR17_012417 [Elasticomyces elasticus]
MADPKDTPCLMGLPPELREMIWTFAVLEPHPIMAYVRWQTVPSSQKTSYKWYQDRGITAAREMKAVPELPPLAFVAKGIGREVMPIFFSNTFLFSIDRRNVGEVGTGWIPLDSNITIRVEFGVPRSRIATIEYTMRHLNGHERFRAKLDGQLTDECRCWLADASKALDEESLVLHGDVESYDKRWGMGELTGIVERRIRDVWSIRKRNGVSATCSTCGNTQYQSEVDESRNWYMWPKMAAVL